MENNVRSENIYTDVEKKKKNLYQVNDIFQSGRRKVVKIEMLWNDMIS